MMQFGLSASFSSQRGLTAPYPSYFEEGRTNRGFTDLRGRPDLAAQTAEAVDSPALRALLVSLADVSSPFFSLGCDVGEHEEIGGDNAPIFVAGGYIDIISRDYNLRSEVDYRDIAAAIEDTMTPDAVGHRWVIDFGLKFCCIKLDGNIGEEVVPALGIGFFAAGEAAELARHNREVMLAAVVRSLQSGAVTGLINTWLSDDDLGTVPAA